MMDFAKASRKIESLRELLVEPHALVAPHTLPLHQIALPRPLAEFAGLDTARGLQALGALLAQRPEVVAESAADYITSNGLGRMQIGATVGISHD